MELSECKKIEQSIIKRYRKDIWRPFVHAINEYKMIENGDKIAVCISGGKDSSLLAKCMQELLRHGKMKFELVFLVMNPGYRNTTLLQIEENCKKLGIPITMFETQIFDAAFNAGGSPCYLCARMRRGYLYKKAQELGCNKIALGHHFNDVIETILMSMLYGAEMKTMVPKLFSQNYLGMELIRPLYLIKEKDIINWSRANNLEFIRCACKFTEKEALEVSGGKRLEIKNLIADLKKINPLVDINILRSSENINTDTILGFYGSSGNKTFLQNYELRRRKVKKAIKSGKTSLGEDAE